jgi:hypothetical protein
MSDRCSHTMSTGEPCGRLVHLRNSDQPAGPAGQCVMHSADPRKDTAAFDNELREMNIRKDFDFTGFIFTAPFILVPTPFDMHFDGARFLKSLTVDSPWYRSRLWRERVEFGGIISFSDTMFSMATFDGGEFTRGVVFRSARFSRRASFNDVVFGDGVTFSQARFAASVSFVGTSFGPKVVEDIDPVDSKKTVTFIETVFEKPDEVLFRDVNVKAQQGLRLRARACDVEKFRFQNVRWHREAGRIVLQDELDLRAAVRLRPPGQSLRRYRHNLFVRARYGSFEEYPRDAHASVTITYNQLIRNFDETLDSDAAEDAFCGAMEMKRLAPESRPFNRYLGSGYDRFYWFGAAVSWLSVVAMYKILSEYGSSYRRGFLILVLLLGVFAALYSTLGGLTIAPCVTTPGRALSSPLMAVLAAIEVASFQRDATVIITTGAGRAVRLIENVVVPGQAAIVLLALRRRFKR